MLIGIVIVATLLMVVILVMMRKHYLKKITHLREEIKVFKNSNEYQEEAVVIFSENFEVLSANRSAKKLLQLEPYRQGEVADKAIKFQEGKSEIFTLSEIIDKYTQITKGTIRLDNISMLIEDHKKSVNVYIDHSKWNSQDSYICVFQDISSELLESELKKQFGEVDFLTNLPSQFQASRDINQLVITAQRENKKISFFLFGIDNFENMKSSFGFGYTNSLLKNFAEFLKNLDNDKRSSYRLESDNFLYIVEDIISEDEVIEIGYELNKNLVSFFSSRSKDRELSFSIGSVIFPDHGRNSSKLIDHAYIALMESKKDPKSSIALFKKEQFGVRDNEKKLVEEIKSGLKNREFEVYYQPIIDLRSTSIVGAEALVRWNHPELGLLMPNRFIRLAEESGLIVGIGEFVIEEVISQHKKWLEEGLESVEISVNLSARELLEYQLAEKLEQLFKESSVNPSFFNLDMSEEDAMKDMVKTDYEFSILQDIGVNLSLDHFGTSGSSIDQLQKLPIHTLKVDRSILKNIDRNYYHQETFKAIVVLAHALSMKVVAEGIETKEQYEVLQNLGCDRAQGHIFSKPAPALEFQALLKGK